MEHGNSKCGFNKMFTDYKQEFRELTQQSCWYCGSKPAHMYRGRRECRNFYLGNGIDRVDNDEGYVWENCVAACTICNRMKLALPAELFINQICKITTHLGI